MTGLKEFVINQIKTHLVSNVPGTMGSAHLSYLAPENFFSSLLKHHEHPNRLEHGIISQELLEHFKTITLTDYRHNGKSIKSDFSLGFGPGIAQAICNGSPCVYYSTGCSNLFQMRAVELEANYMKSLGLPLSMKEFRIPDGFYGLSEALAARIYVIGSAWTASTFNHPGVGVDRLPGIPLGLDGSSYHDVLRSRRIERGRLLWIGSKGVLHKGLHLAAEVAKRLGRTLVIIGVAPSSRQFAVSLLETTGVNFEMHGHLRVGGSEWNELLSGVALTIGCSVTEGMSTSLLTAGLFGAYPIATETSGIELGHVLPNLPLESRVDALVEAVDSFLGLPENSLKDLGRHLSQTISEKNSPLAFRKALSGYLTRDLANFCGGITKCSK